MDGTVPERRTRPYDALRPVSFERHYTRYAEGSVLAVLGETRVLCTATVEDRVPLFLRGTDQGWITAEYAMLPRSTDRRTQRASRSGISGRSAEIQRLIGRALRISVDLHRLGPRTVTIDCDVLQADGGTRVASVNGGYVALVDALRTLRDGGHSARCRLCRASPPSVRGSSGALPASTSTARRIGRRAPTSTSLPITPIVSSKSRGPGRRPLFLGPRPTASSTFV